jgi:hypothetical protein
LRRPETSQEPLRNPFMPVKARDAIGSDQRRRT